MQTTDLINKMLDGLIERAVGCYLLTSDNIHKAVKYTPELYESIRAEALRRGSKKGGKLFSDNLIDILMEEHGEEPKNKKARDKLIEAFRKYGDELHDTKRSEEQKRYQEERISAKKIGREDAEERAKRKVEPKETESPEYLKLFDDWKSTLRRGKDATEEDAKTENTLTELLNLVGSLSEGTEEELTRLKRFIREKDLLPKDDHL